MGGSSAGAALDGFVHLVASQVATRAITFSLNLLAARSLSPEAYGVASVQFHLINTTILLLSREGFRRACLRVEAEDPRATAKVLGTGLLTLPLGAALSAGLTALLLRAAAGAGAGADYRAALLMQGGAAALELAAEPLYLLAASRLQFRLRVAVETAATLLKGLLLLLLLELASTPPVLAFSWAQLAYAGATLAGYLLHFAPQYLRHLRARGCGAGGAPQPPNQQWRGSKRGGQEGPPALELDRPLLRLAGAFTLQAGEKLVLAEGSKMALAAATGPADQGVYGLVANLGSLVVRTLFQPFEEAAFAAFSKARGQRAPTPAALRQQALLLAALTRCIALVGLATAAFGPAYAHAALALAYGPRWAASGAPAALGAYACYVPLLALNGTLEAFVHAVASEAQLRRVNAWLVAFAAVHVALALLGLRGAGALGLVAADAAGMALRIAYALRFVAAHFALVPGFSLRQLSPRSRTLAAYAAAAAFTCASRLALLPESAGAVGAARRAGLLPAPLAALAEAVGGAPLLPRMAAHVAVGAACLVALAGALYAWEREVVTRLRQLRKGAKEG